MKRVVLKIGGLVTFLAAVAIGAETVAGSTPAADSGSAVQAVAADTLKKFTIVELATYNGKDGQRAYVAIKDSVYDVTDVKPWKGGAHHGLKAGVDQTAKIKMAPHGAAVLKKLKVVGIIVKK